MSRIVESVANYPRPPLLEKCSGHVRVVIANQDIAVSDCYFRVCETFHPPTIYLPQESFQGGTLHSVDGRPSFCEWKGLASYFDLTTTDRQHRRSKAAWQYQNPTEGFSAISRCVSLYPGQVDACFLEGEQVKAQPGLFYGGWITSWTIGPFKGDPAHPELV